MQRKPEGRWLLLIHNLPPKPAYFRVKIWRRLQGLGAVAVKSSVYVLPRSEANQESFHWVCREITQGGGDATLCSAHLLEGLTDAQVEALFARARAAEYEALADEARKLAKSVRRGSDSETPRLRKRLAEISAIDFFGAAGREDAEAAIERLERARSHGREAATPKPRSLSGLAGKTWVTREGIHVDRMASAWLIRRFIDPKARFKFVPAKGYVPRRGEIRFDMYDAELTHEGDLCTFEILVRNLGSRDPALRALAEIIHDIDLKDGKHGRVEAAGVDVATQGIHLAHATDPTRLEGAIVFFDGLYRSLGRRKT